MMNRSIGSFVTFCRGVVFSLGVLLCLAIFGGVANAQLCTLTAGGATYTIPAASHYDATQTSNFTGVGTGDYLFEDGWWFRVSGDTQEFFFPAPTTTTCAGANGTITWSNVSSRGLFSATNTLNLTSAAVNTGKLTLTMSITNLSAVNPLTISLFHGADFDVNGSAGTDNATLLFPNTHHSITDTTAGFAQYRAFNPAATATLVRPFGATTDVFGLLGNAVVNNFDNSGIPATNFDYTGGFQWDLVIPGSGSASVSVILTGNDVVTAAGAAVSGRVLTPGGAGVRNATVTLTDSQGVTQTARSTTFGYFRFEDVRVGETYVLGVESKRYSFTPRTLEIQDEVTGLDVTADSER
ncbi:MAG: carboxypeptidase regulatory-like domain-containing protein [Acidobacteria bacterium]|nr:carboxypeptidase regulatory-like domain-containing protein [Acidobacteriota bacterium]